MDKRWTASASIVLSQQLHFTSPRYLFHAGRLRPQPLAPFDRSTLIDGYSVTQAPPNIVVSAPIL